MKTTNALSCIYVLCLIFGIITHIYITIEWNKVKRERDEIVDQMKQRNKEFSERAERAFLRNKKEGAE